MPVMQTRKKGKAADLRRDIDALFKAQKWSGKPDHTTIGATFLTVMVTRYVVCAAVRRRTNASRRRNWWFRPEGYFPGVRQCGLSSIAVGVTA